MIVIAGNQPAALDESQLNALERAIYVKKNNSSVKYRYASVGVLLFELRMRTRIVESARALGSSGARFASFKDSQCNEAVWHRTEYGGFKLKKGVSPRAAIADIFMNGSMYAFECATAVVIVLYKSVADSIEPGQFDRLFADLLLFDWQYDRDLRLIDRKNVEEAVPGDILYFDNPEFSPETPWWRGENAVKLGENLYYAHPMGVTNAQGIINVLNKYRKPGSTKSAFLTDRFSHPDFAYLQRFQPGGSREKPIVAKIGSRTYAY
jgi:protein-glutamine gamma-glutamyltransferase